MGAITKATAEAPCPLFAGRGLDQRGFTIKMPYKEYLSCVEDNIDQEKAILGVYNYDLADRAYNDDTDAVAFQVYTYLGANAANVTTGRNIHALDVLCKVDYDYAVATNRRNADVRGARIQVYGHQNVSGVCTGAYINCQLKGAYTFSGYYLEYTQSYGGIGLEVRTETSTDTVAAGDGTNYGIAGLLVTYKGSSALTGNYHAIVLHEPYEGGAISGSSVGIYFMNTAILAGTDFDIGIDFGDSHVVKAIDIGACTTGIEFTGAMTQGLLWSVAPSTRCITVNASLVIPEFLNIGTWGNDVQWDGTDEFIDILVETTLVTVAKPLMRVRLEADNDADMTTGALETFELVCANATTYDSYSMMALNCKTQFKGTMEALTGGVTIGASIGISALTNVVTVTGDIYPLEVTCDAFASGSSFDGQSAWIFLNNTVYSVVPESLIRFRNASSASGEDTEYLIDIENLAGGSCKPFTTDTVDTDGGDSDACLKCIIGGTVYEIPLFTA